MKITRDKYYQAYAFLITAKKLQTEVRVFEKLFTDIIGDTKLTDLIYDPDRSFSKDEFDKLLLELGFEVDWNGKQIESEAKKKHG